MTFPAAREEQAPPLRWDRESKNGLSLRGSWLRSRLRGAEKAEVFLSAGVRSQSSLPPSKPVALPPPSSEGGNGDAAESRSEGKAIPLSPRCARHFPRRGKHAERRKHQRAAERRERADRPYESLRGPGVLIWSGTQQKQQTKHNILSHGA